MADQEEFNHCIAVTQLTTRQRRTLLLGLRIPYGEGLPNQVVPIYVLQP